MGTRGSAGNLLPPLKSFRPNEVLAYNLTEADFARIEQRKFKILDTIELPSLNFTVTRLETPNIQNAFIGRSALQEELPTSGFGLNHIYRADRTRPANAPAQHRWRSRAREVRCGSGDCFAGHQREPPQSLAALRIVASA